MKKILVALICLFSACGMTAQERRLQHRPYIDQRGFHYGFLFGVHMQDLGHPVVGDGRYGPDDGLNPLRRLALHAFKLCFYHPVTGRPMAFETPYPADFKRLVSTPQR